MSGATRWVGGDAEIHRAVEAWVRGEENAAAVLRDGPRRTVVRLDVGGRSVLAKRFRQANRLGARLKRRLRLGPAEREWRALRATWRAGVSVPRAEAWAQLPGGDQVLCTEWLEGGALPECVPEHGPRRRELFAAIGRCVAAFHESGFVHRDLHADNVLITRRGPVLIDLQSAARSSNRGKRIADLGHLDYSLWLRSNMADRMIFRRAALGKTRDVRTAVRAVGIAAKRRASRHMQSRALRATRPGRRFARVSVGRARGIRLRTCPGEQIELALTRHWQALEAGGDAVRKDEGRSRITLCESVFVKETSGGGLPRSLWDRVRGSAARRAFRAHYALESQRIGAPTALAFLEFPRGMGIGRSVLVAEGHPELEDGLAAAERQPESAVDALIRVLVDLHARGIDHGDVKATNFLLQPAEDALEALILDLESLRIRGALSDERRIEALAQLNASLPDGISAAVRLAAFDTYRRATFWRGDRAAQLREVTRRSLAKRHRWTGQGCSPTP